MKVHFHCQYCGNQWKDMIYGDHGMLNVRCSMCRESKNIKAHKETSEKLDVYGYRFSPAFPEKRSSEYKYIYSD